MALYRPSIKSLGLVQKSHQDGAVRSRTSLTVIYSVNATRQSVVGVILLEGQGERGLLSSAQQFFEHSHSNQAILNYGDTSSQQRWFLRRTVAGPSRM